MIRRRTGGWRAWTQSLLLGLVMGLIVVTVAVGCGLWATGNARAQQTYVLLPAVPGFEPAGMAILDGQIYVIDGGNEALYKLRIRAGQMENPWAERIGTFDADGDARGLATYSSNLHLLTTTKIYEISETDASLTERVTHGKTNVGYGFASRPDGGFFTASFNDSHVTWVAFSGTDNISSGGTGLFSQASPAYSVHHRGSFVQLYLRLDSDGDIYWGTNSESSGQLPTGITAFRNGVGVAPASESDKNSAYIWVLYNGSWRTRVVPYVENEVSFTTNFSSSDLESAPPPTLNPEPVRYAVRIVNGRTYTSEEPSITRLTYDLSCPPDPDNASCADDARRAVVSMDWQAVSPLTGYQVERRGGGTYADGSLLLESDGAVTRTTDIVDAADVQARTSVGYRVRAYLYAHEEQQLQIGSRAVVIPEGATVYSGWSRWRDIVVSEDTGVFAEDVYAAEPLRDTLSSPLGQLVSIPANMAGINTGYQPALVTLAALLVSGAAGVGFYVLTGGSPVSLAIGAAMALLCYGIGGPVLAGQPEAVAAVPAVALVLVGGFWARGRMGR